MGRLRVKAAGVLLAILVVSMEFTPKLLASRVLAQQDGYEDFLSRLETYLKDALPPESDPIKECEYIIPDGFNASTAERLWRIVGPLVSMGASRENITSVLEKNSQNGFQTGGFFLNFSSTIVEKHEDGSVMVKTPVVSSKPLNYTHYNSTGVKMLYEAWNETLVRLYMVERRTGLYRYVIKDVEEGVVFSIVSRLTVNVYPEPEVGKIMLFHPEENWPWFLGNPIIAVPGHYEEVKTLVPEHEESHRVLFPAYDPVIVEGWIIHTTVSQTSLTLGGTLEISYWAEYSSLNGVPTPLNASLRLNAPDAFEPIDSVERILNDTHASGVFRLRAVKPGLHNVTLVLSGNACFATWPPSEQVSYAILVVGPESPSVSVRVLNVDPSILKHAGLLLELVNNGGSVARNVSIQASGLDAEPASLSMGDVEAGGFRRVELTLRLKKDSSEVTIRAYYRDEEGNNYFSEAEAWVWTRSIWVPEHYEEIRVLVPEHEEATRVFIPGLNYSTHVRFYTLTFSSPGSEMVAAMPSFQGHYGGFELVSRLAPMGTVELNASKGAEAFSKADFILLSIEPYFEQVGVFEEKNVAEILGVKPGLLRSNSSIGEYRTRLVSQTWRISGSILLSPVEFEAYNNTLKSFVAENNLQGEFKIGWRRLTNATRLAKPSSETGFLTLIYRPLSVKGSGPLRSIQVRNYSRYNLSYVMEVQQFGRQAYMNHPPMMDVYSSPLNVNGGEYNVSLAGLNAAEAYTCLVKLFFGSNLVAEAVFDLSPEPSPFWRCFWEEVRGRVPWILATSTIIILVGFLTGHSTTAAYAGLAVSIVSTVIYLVSGTVLNWIEIEQCRDMYSFFNYVADTYRDWSYELSNYTPPETPGPPIEAPRPFEPKGPLAKLYWNYSQYFRGAAARILEDTVLDLVVGCGVTDFETAMNQNASECARGRATGRIVSAALSFTAFIIANKIASIEAKTANTKTPWKLVSAVKAWVTPAIYDLLETLVKSRRVIAFIARNPGQALQIGKFLIFKGLKAAKSVASETWELVKDKLKELVEKIESGAEKIEDSWQRMVERLKGFLSLHDELYNYAKNAGQEEAIGVSHKFDGAGFEVPEQAEAFRILDEIAVKSRLAEKALSELLKQLEPERLKKAVNLMAGMEGLEKSVLDDFGKAWMLNKDADDLYGLLKGLSMAPDYPAQGSKFYELLHKCVEDNDPNEVSFLGRSYNWITEIRKMELEPGERFAKHLEETFPFVEGCVDSLGGEELEKVADILDNLLATRGRRGAYEEMLNLKKNLFEDILLGTDAPKNWLVEECLEKWVEASMLSDAIVSHQIIDENGHYRARSPVEVNYLDAGDGKVIPIIADEDKKGGFGITIPQDAAEYLRLKDEGFLIFFKNLPQDAEVILPIKAESDGKVAVAKPLERLFKAWLPNHPEYSSFIQNGEIKWGEFQDRGILLKFEAVEPKSGISVEKALVITDPEGESIRIRIGEGFGDKLLVFRGFQFLEAKWLIDELKELGFTDTLRERFMKLYGSVMVLGKDEVVKLVGTKNGIYEAVGRIGEGETTLFIARKKGGSYIEDLRRREVLPVKIGDEMYVELDIVTIKELLDAKYWNEERFREKIIEASEESFQEEIINGLRKYKVMMDGLKKERVFLVLVEEIPEETFKQGEARIRDALGGDTSWLRIINGLSNLNLEG